MYTEKQQIELAKKYVSEMETIKLRGNSIFSTTSINGYFEPAVEFQALQMRKIIEQIILCSLITNADKYLEQYKKLGKVWNIKFICNDIKRINPQYLPNAVTDNHDQHECNNNPDVTLSEDELLGIHEKMGHLLHAHNPFSERIDYQYFSEYIKNSYRRIYQYLYTHTIRLYDESDVPNDILFVVMNASNHNGHVVANWCTRVDTIE